MWLYRYEIFSAHTTHATLVSRVHTPSPRSPAARTQLASHTDSLCPTFSWPLHLPLCLDVYMTAVCVGDAISWLGEWASLWYPPHAHTGQGFWITQCCCLGLKSGTWCCALEWAVPDVWKTMVPLSSMVERSQHCQISSWFESSRVYGSVFWVQGYMILYREGLGQFRPWRWRQPSPLKHC